MSALVTFLRPFAQRKVAAFGLVFVVMVLALAVLAPWIAPYDPIEINAIERLQEPSAAHWFGTDHAGRDLFSRVVYGARMALLTGFGVVVIALVFGVLLGTLSAYFPLLGLALMRIVDEQLGDGSVVTYADYEAISNRCAHLLRACGLKAGDCFAIYMENNAMYLPLAWGGMRAGLRVTTIATHLTRDEIDYILENSGAKVLLTSAAMGEKAVILRETAGFGADD